MRGMKWHIYNNKNLPLCWDNPTLEDPNNDSVLDFSSYEDALALAYLLCDVWNITMDEIIIKEDILYYDGGYIDMDKYNLIWNEELNDFELEERQ